MFTGLTSALMAEGCRGERTQGQKPVLKISYSTVEERSVWQDICVATETGGQMHLKECT
jgi:hypothetical protein